MFSQKKAPMLSPRAKLEQQYKTSRMNLLLVIIFTIISMATIYLNGSYFLFTAQLPLAIFTEGVLYQQIADGTYAYMAELTAEDISYYTDLSDTMLIVGIVAAVIILAVYFICWLASKKHPAAMVVAAVFFGIDCVILLMGFSVDYIVDIIFHAWVMYYLIAAIVASSKLKKLPPEEEAPVEGTYTVINGEKVPSAGAAPIEDVVNVETGSNEDNSPAE